MNRRSFIGSILALASAPAIVRADSLMRIVPLDRLVVFGESTVHIDGLEEFFTDGVHVTAEGLRVVERHIIAAWGDSIWAPINTIGALHIEKLGEVVEVRWPVAKE